VTGTSGIGPVLTRVLFAVVVSIGIYVFAPPERDGASQIHHARARAVTGALEPGESAPIFPGSTVWTSGLLAGADQTLSIFRQEEGESWIDYVRSREESHRTVLRWAFALLASLLFLRAVELSVTATGVKWLWASLFVGLALGPYLLEAVSRLSPGLLASWMFLELTAAWLATRPRVGWFSAIAGGVLLAWAPFLWPVVLFFVVVGLLNHRPIGSFLARMLLLGLLAAALDPSRLVDLGNGFSMAWLDWKRSGGFPPVGLALPSGSLRPPGLAWGTIVVGLIGWGTWLWKRRQDRRGALLWLLGSAALIVLGPWTAGVRVSGPVQESAVPALTLGVAALVAELLRRPSSIRRLAPIGLLLVLALGWLPLFSSQSRLAPLALGEKIRPELTAHIGDGLLLSERTLPGDVPLPGRSFLLPRDSRDPKRFEFAYWPRWYANFDYVLLSASQVRQNLKRGGVPAHFYQELLDDSDLIAEWGTGEVQRRLYRIRESSQWKIPLRAEDMSALTAVPELGPFLSQLGTLSAEAGHLQTAVVIFEEGIRLAPSSPSMYNNLGSLYLLEEEWEAAARVLSDGLGHAPESTEMLYNSGRAHYELGSFERAEQLFRRSVNLRPDFGKAHYELGRAFLAQEKRRLAQMALENYLEIEPNSEKSASVQGVLEQLRGANGVPRVENRSSTGPESSSPSDP